MSEETPELNDIKLEVEEPTVDAPEVVPEVVATEPEKPKRKTRKTTDEPAKSRAGRKKKVEVVAVELEPQAAAPTPEPTPTPTPEPTPEPATPTVNHTDFFKVQQGMADLQAEFRRLRRESKATQYRKLLEGNI